MDGIAERVRPGRKREPVLVAWGFTETGKRVLPHIQSGSKEDAETVSAFFQDMRSRGLGDPVPAVSDGAPGIIKAIETCFPRSERQRCLAHRMRNLSNKVPEHQWPEGRGDGCGRPARRRAGRRPACSRRGWSRITGTGCRRPAACFMEDFNACIARKRVPVVRRKPVRTANLPERLFAEERRRLKIIPDAFGGKAFLKPVFGATVRAAERWRSIRSAEFERRRTAAVREELGKEYEAGLGLEPPPETRHASENFPGDFRT